MKFIFSLIVLILIFSSRVSAQTATFANKPFGGKTFIVRYCHCSHNYRIWIGPPQGSTYWGNKWFIYQPRVSRLFEFGQITKQNVWTLGTWETYGVCVYGGDCDKDVTGPRISTVGTSR